MEALREFFGIGGYVREADGFMSWPHLLMCAIALATMVLLGLWIGEKYKNRSAKEKNVPLMWAAILIDAQEIIRIVFLCIREDDWAMIRVLLPLFLCGVQCFTLPLAAWGKGRLKEGAMDFVFVFGILSALAGTVMASNVFGVSPAFSYEGIQCLVSHGISGFGAVYIAKSGLLSMKKKNIFITFAIMLGFCGLAYLANVLLDYNYFFLRTPDGTPFELAWMIVGGNSVLYTLFVVALHLLYIVVFYLVYYAIVKAIAKKKAV